MLRRWLYGIFLTSCSLLGHAVAAAEPPQPNKKPKRRADEVLFTAHFDMDARNMIRSGVDVDVNLVGIANLQLKVPGGRDQGESGRRWAFGTGSSTSQSGRTCSFAATVDFVQVAPYGAHKLVFVPQLNMALDTMVGAPTGMTAAVRYGHWTRQALDDKGTVGSQVPQLFLHWSF